VPGLEAILNVIYYGLIGIISIICYVYYLVKRSTEDAEQVYKSPYEGNTTGRGKLVDFEDEQQKTVA
jgi:hypothetical protein